MTERRPSGRRFALATDQNKFTFRTAEQLQRRILRTIAEEAYRFVRPKIPSTQLQRGLVIVPDFLRPTERLLLYIPHYWAVYVHDGRGGFGPKNARLLIYFKNPKNDPRLNNGESPIRAQHIKRLTVEQFRYWSHQNFLADPQGNNPGARPMIVRRHVGPAKGTPFFSNEPGGGMSGFAAHITPKVNKIAQDFITEALADLNETAVVELKMNA